MMLKGKMAIITGGGTGIGASTAKRFVVESVKVSIAGCYGSLPDLHQ